MGAAGITAVGTYVPRSRLRRATIAAATGWANPAARRASGASAVCNWDEDSITLAVAAARDCVPRTERQRIDALWLASTTLPFADRDNAVVVAGALELRPDVRTTTSAASQRAATSALIAALAAADGTGSDGNHLVVAADRRAAQPGSDQELSYGHGAAAICIGRKDVVAQCLGHASLAADLVDHYRQSGAHFDYALEARWVRDEGYLKLVPQAIAAALREAGERAAAVSHFVFAAPATVARKVMQSAGLTTATLTDSMENSCGDTGAAHPLLMLALALETAAAGELMVLVSFGQGVDALVLRATAAITRVAQRRSCARRMESGVEEPHYLRYLSNSALIDMDWGLRAERDNRTAHSVAYRRREEITAFVGGRCSACGTVQFPRARVCVNPECRATDTLEPHPLAHTRGRVKSFTEDWLAFTPRPPLIYGNVELEGGGNLMMEMTDVEPGELAVGSEVAMAFRIKDLDRTRAFTRYFWKAVPAARAGES